MFINGGKKGNVTLSIKGLVWTIGIWDKAVLCVFVACPSRIGYFVSNLGLPGAISSSVDTKRYVFHDT